MPLKTLLTPEEQWSHTMRYVEFLRQRQVKQALRRIHELGPRNGASFSPEELARIHQCKKALEPDLVVGGLLLWIVRTTHRLLALGDVLVVTRGNGMVERYGMTGVSSKGARLNDYHIPLHSHVDVFQLPGDLIDLRWDDPAIGRFVADLRASSRRRVGASIPAPNPTPHMRQGTDGLRFDGYYRSRREPRHKRGNFFQRNHLRFFPDGRVISAPTYVASGPGGISREGFMRGPWDTSGWFIVEGASISFNIELDGEVVERYQGKVDGEHLHLSRQCRKGWARSRDHDVYKFHLWRE